MKNKNWKEFKYHFLLIYVMVLSLNLPIIDSSGMKVSLGVMGIYNALIVAFVLLMIYIPWTVLIFSGGCIAWLGYTWYVHPGSLWLLYQKAILFSDWLFRYMLSYQAFELGYSLVFGLAYSIFVSLIISYFVVSGRGSFWLIALGTGAITFFWFIYVEKARVYVLIFLFAALLTYAYNSYKKRCKEWQKSGTTMSDNIMKNWVASAAIILTISLLISSLLPLNIKPIKWQWLNDKAVNMFPFITEWRNDTMDSYSYGFSSRYNLGKAGYKALGGPVILDKSVMLSVETQSYDALYLRGSVKNDYSGSNWSKYKWDEQQIKLTDKSDSPFSDNNINMYKLQLRIIPQKLLTSTIFAPNQLYRVSFKDYKYFIDPDSEAYFSKMILRDESYNVESVIPYLNEQKLRAVNTKENKAEDKNWQPYLKLPENISQRTIDLSHKITVQYDNDYDKAKAIESYLRSNYKYTLSPSNIPMGREFTDYFLFDGKEGYCTYFATAMAVLLRASDIPCRYVEGFLSKPDKQSIRYVKGTDAHAWVEVPFGAYGWVTFEATPAYSVAALRDEPKAAAETSTPSSNGSANPSDTQIISVRDRNLEMDDTGVGASDVVKNKFDYKKSILIFILILIFVLIVRISYCIYANIKMDLRIRKYKDRKYIEIYLKRIFWYYRYLRFEISPEKTLREFFTEVRSISGNSYSDMNEFVNILERARYGEYTITSEERVNLGKFYQNLKQYAASNLGKFNLYLHLYLLGK